MTGGGPPARVIGLDWGTTRLRAYLLSREGVVEQVRQDRAGIMAVEDGGFPRALNLLIGDWLEANPSLPIVASGMVGSRQGWVEVPYVSCPARFAALGRATREVAWIGRRGVHVVPGLSYVDGSGVPDVMRGEETQILGALGDSTGSSLALLPGTHSKWVWVNDQQIERFRTFMTGELFGLLCEHGILGRLMDGTRWRPEAFLRGVHHARDVAARGGGLLGHLFSARTLALFGHLPETDVHAYLSGLLIGTEIDEGVASGSPAPQRVLLMGSDDLLERYSVALEAAGIDTTRSPPDCAAIGHARVARDAGLL